ncbi:MAG: hypothetical protein ACXWCS_14280 [Burkholderiales bacterium]
MQHVLSYVALVLPSVLLLISEILPFTKGKANGILHAILSAGQQAEKVLPEAPKAP